MSDLFHENLADETIDRVFAVMALCPQHTFQVLTKRPARMMDYFSSTWFPGSLKPVTRFGLRVREAAISSCMQAIIECKRLAPVLEWFGLPLPNVWLGVSVENQATADERIPLLLQTPAAVRWISAEPLLGPIDLAQIPNSQSEAEGQRWLHSLEGYAWECSGTEYYDTCNINAHLDWVVVGGESGSGARPMHPEWARSLRDQCVAAGVAFHFKQWGEWLPAMCDGAPGDFQHLSDEPSLVGKRKAGRLLDGRTWDEYPAVQP
jgi:protein gp37